MRKVILRLLIGSVCFVSCTHKEEIVRPVDINKKADSIVNARMGEMRKAAMEDLDIRKAIEVKPKADSIVAAAMQRRIKDTVKK